MQGVFRYHRFMVVDAKFCICEYCSARMLCKGCVKGCKSCGIRPARCKENYIRVLYRDETYGNVKDTALDNLIAGAEIAKFHRSSGWVAIGSDPIRVGTNHFDGIERRRLLKKAIA